MRRLWSKSTTAAPQLRSTKRGAAVKANHPNPWIRRILFAVPLILLIVSQIQSPQYTSSALLLGSLSTAKDSADDDDNTAQYTGGLRGSQVGAGNLDEYSEDSDIDEDPEEPNDDDDNGKYGASNDDSEDKSDHDSNQVVQTKDYTYGDEDDVVLDGSDPDDEIDLEDQRDNDDDQDYGDESDGYLEEEDGGIDDLTDETDGYLEEDGGPVEGSANEGISNGEVTADGNDVDGYNEDVEDGNNQEEETGGFRDGGASGYKAGVESEEEYIEAAEDGLEEDGAHLESGLNGAFNGDDEEATAIE